MKGGGWRVDGYHGGWRLECGGWRRTATDGVDDDDASNSDGDGDDDDDDDDDGESNRFVQ